MMIHTARLFDTRILPTMSRLLSHSHLRRTNPVLINAPAKVLAYQLFTTQVPISFASTHSKVASISIKDSADFRPCDLSELPKNKLAEEKYRAASEAFGKLLFKDASRLLKAVIEIDPSFKPAHDSLMHIHFKYLPSTSRDEMQAISDLYYKYFDEEDQARAEPVSEEESLSHKELR